jgi:hypothetical protein
MKKQSLYWKEPIRIVMAEEETKEKGKIEGAAEKTGEVVGKGVKKGIEAVKGFGKGLKEGVTKKEEEVTEKEEGVTKKKEEVQLSVSIDKDLIDWVKEGVEKKTFAHVSQAFELALTQLRERTEKKYRKP